MMWDEKRFILLNEFLSVEVAAVYIKNAAALKESQAWKNYPADMKWEAPARTVSSGKELAETVKLYLLARNNYYDCDGHAARFQTVTQGRLIEDFFEIRIARAENVSAVCAPRPLDEEYREAVGMTPEEFEAAGKKFWGFGLAHPYKGDAFEPHKRIAGPLIFHKEFDASGSIRNFEFRPIFVKIFNGDVSRYYRVSVDLGIWINTKFLSESEVPPELIAYDFSDKRQKVARREAVPDSFERSAALNRFVKPKK